MAWSSKEIRKKKYLPFPGHTDAVSARYHSRNLPNPNVIRIEVLSPSARAQYLNQSIYASMQTFQQALMESFLGDPDATKPFYGFFDPKTEGVAFELTADWKRNKKHGFGEIAESIKKFPVVGGKVGGLVDAAQEMSKRADSLVKQAGIDTTSTGACTMKDFDEAEFKFDKKITCRWYLPEQEKMARLSISRLLKLAFVRTMNLDGKDIVSELTKAASNLMSNPALDDVVDSVVNTVDGIKGTVKNSTLGPLASTVGEVANIGGGMVGGMVDYVTKAAKIIADESGVSSAVNKVKEAMPDMSSLIKDVMKQAVNGGIDAAIKINTLFGGNLTINPFPVRLTMGHILDIEPVVIRSVEFKSSKEQFISEDGTHIPLYITAEIGFTMWMIPDPKKGFIRWMGDDVFNSGGIAAKATSGTKSSTSSKSGGSKKKGAAKTKR